MTAISPLSYSPLLSGTTDKPNTTVDSIKNTLASVPKSEGDSVNLSPDVSALLDQFASIGNDSSDLVGTLLGGNSEGLVADSYSSLLKTAYQEADIKASQDAIDANATQQQSLLDAYHAYLNAAGKNAATSTSLATAAPATTLVA